MSATITPGILAVVLITQLGSPRYSQRAVASRALYRMTPLVVPYLEAARGHGDLEISQRSDQILAMYYKSVADKMTDRIRPKGWPRHPWLDMLPQSHPERKRVIDFFVHKAQKKIGRKGPPDWGDYRLATQLYVRELFLEQNPPSCVRRMLNTMANSERDWIQKNGKKYTPPLKVPPQP